MVFTQPVQGMAGGARAARRSVSGYVSSFALCVSGLGQSPLQDFLLGGAGSNITGSDTPTWQGSLTSPDASAPAGPSSGQVKLMDGRIVNVSDINFNTSTQPPNGYHFTLSATGEDLTNQITRADKLANWPNFDPTLDNDRLYRERQITRTGTDPGPPPSTDTLGYFVQGVSSDLQKIATPAALVGDVKDILFIGGIVLAVYLAIKP